MATNELIAFINAETTALNKRQNDAHISKRFYGVRSTPLFRFDGFILALNGTLFWLDVSGTLIKIFTVCVLSSRSS